MKIYCCDCRFCGTDCSYEGTIYHCWNPLLTNKMDNPAHKIELPAYCEANKNNDCVYFQKRTLYDKFLSFLSWLG
jgi:hypothetical protein